jgi:TPR repeat protein
VEGASVAVTGPVPAPAAELHQRLRELEERAKLGPGRYSRAGVVRTANLKLSGGLALSESTVSEWINNNRVPQDFQQLWAFVSELLALADGRPRDSVQSRPYWVNQKAYWKGLYTAACQTSRTARTDASRVSRDALAAAGTAVPPPPHARQASEVDFAELGVHPALGLADARPAGQRARRDWYPPYVPRDRDEQIDQALMGGGLVIVEGRSGSGKSRVAAEAVRRVAADRQLLIPAGPDELAALSEPPGRLHSAVVWLDNLERFGGPGGLDLPMLERLCPQERQDVVIVATLRSEERQWLERRPGIGSGNPASTADALRVATVVRLGPEFSAVERERAAAMRADPRIAHWLDHGGPTGLAEYLAAGPPAVDRWLAGRDGENVLGAALVSAAVDCRRLRHTEPLPLDRLTELARIYLDPRDAHRPGRPTIEQALEWATEPVSGASSCLLPQSEDRYWAFDYLVDHRQRDPDAPPIPEGVLSALLSWVPDEEARYIIGQVAVGVFDTDQPRLADLALARFGQIVGFDDSFEFVAGVLTTTSFSNRGPDWEFSTRYVRWLRPFADEGNAVAIGLIGITLLTSTDGDIEQGEIWLRRATAAGDDESGREIARLLQDTGRRTELEAWIDDAVAAGRGEGIVVGFANALLSEGKRTEAKHWCRRAADLGDPASMVALGELCWEDEEWAEAERRFTTAAEAGHPIGMYDLSLVLERLIGHRRQADEWLRRSAEARYPKAILEYALLLDQRGDEAGLERWLERERAAGDSEHVLAFAIQLAARGDMQGAERWFRHAMEMGNVAAVRGLGDVKQSEGDLNDATQYYQQAIDRGDTIAMYQLSRVYLKQHKPGKAEQLLRGMLEKRSDFRDRPEREEEALGRAARELGRLLENQGKTEEAREMYETATDYGVTEARYDLARLDEKRDK